MLAVNFCQNKILRNWDVKSEAAKRENYKKLLQQRTVKLKNNEWSNPSPKSLLGSVRDIFYDYDDKLCGLSRIGLVKELKNWDVSPQETWDPVFNMKLGIDKRTIWKLQRYYHYAIRRLIVFTDISKQNDNNPKIKQLKGEQQFAEIKKLMPKRVDTIKELVSSDFYQLFF